jgi:hypothetical protein
VEIKKEEIKDFQRVTKDVLENILPLDIIKYCIYPIF